MRDPAFAQTVGKRTCLPGPYGSERSREAFLAGLKLKSTRRRSFVIARSKKGESTVADLAFQFHGSAAKHDSITTDDTPEPVKIKTAVEPPIRRYGPCCFAGSNRQASQRPSSELASLTKSSGRRTS